MGLGKYSLFFYQNIVPMALNAMGFKNAYPLKFINSLSYLNNKYTGQ
jgi:hypothetical protein